MHRLYYVVLYDPTERGILLAETPSGVTLPLLTFEERAYWQETSHLNRAIASRFGFETHMLSCFQIVDDVEREAVRLYVILELLSQTRDTPQGMRWQAVSALGEVNWVEREQQSVVARWLAQADTDRPAWYSPGWSARARSWIEEQVAALGVSSILSIRQLRSWERGATWQVEVDPGFGTPARSDPLYFKAVPPMFAHEPLLSRQLAHWYPHRIPEVLALDEAQSWYLVGRAGQVTLDQVQDLTVWEKALRVYAEIQVGLVDKGTQLLRLGLSDRRPGGRFIASAEEMLHDVAALKASPAGLTGAEIAALRARWPALRSACKRLAAGPIPASLEHGDFTPGQALYDPLDERVNIIDWSDSSISHPFFSLLFLTEDLPGVPGQAADRLRDSYLSVWSPFADREVLLETFDLALQIAPLHHALLYYQWILPNMHLRWEMERMLPYYLRMCISTSPEEP